jgi:hypothetical protein
MPFESVNAINNSLLGAQNSFFALPLIATIKKMWVHHFTPISKGALMEWKNYTSP